MAQDPNPAGAGGDAVVSVEKAQAIRAKLVAQPHCAQANYFLNVYFDTIGDDNELVFALLEQFAKYGEEKKTISPVDFMTVVQEFEKSKLTDSKKQPFKKIQDFPATDGTAISNKFEASGVKEQGRRKLEIPIFDALLAIFGFTLVDTMNLPATPCHARLAAAKAKLAQVINREESLKAQVAAIDAEIDELQAKKETGYARKVFQKNEEKKQVEKQLDDIANQQRKDRNAANTAIAEADAAVKAEEKEGTTATNWLKGQCGKIIKFIPFDLND